MFAKRVISIGVAAAVTVLGVPAIAGITVHNQAVDVVGAAAVSDPLIAVEANRTAIVNRLVTAYSDVLAAGGVSQEAFRSALTGLRADQLLAASLVGTIEEVTAIVEQPPSNGSALQRFVALTPTVPASMNDIPLAQAYLTRDGDVLKVVNATDLQLGSTAQVVGYFAPATTTIGTGFASSPMPVYGATTSASPTVAPDKPAITEKDGSGSGSGSWIGYTAGNNIASGTNSAVAAGSNNQATQGGSSVFAGQFNTADGVSALVIGGFDNHATFTDAMVGGGAGNRATGARAVVVGGGYNLASGGWSFIGGGGRFNVSSGAAGTFVEDHIASGKYSTIGGGQGNRALGLASTISGGQFNDSTGQYASVAGGLNNAATGDRSATLGGSFNTASGRDAIAIGCSANATNAGAILISATAANPCGSDLFFDSAADNEFAVRATGGVRMVSAVNGSGTPTAGVTLASGGGSWASLSDRAAKEDIASINPRTVLAKLVAMPVYTWRYRTEVSRALHLGPTAQDFRAAFGLGDSDKTITMVDEGGVAFAAIKGLKQELDAKDDEIAKLKRELNAIKRKLGLK